MTEKYFMRLKKGDIFRWADRDDWRILKVSPTNHAIRAENVGNGNRDWFLFSQSKHAEIVWLTGWIQYKCDDCGDIHGPRKKTCQCGCTWLRLVHESQYFPGITQPVSKPQTLPARVDA